MMMTALQLSLSSPHCEAGGDDYDNDDDNDYDNDDNNDDDDDDNCVEVVVQLRGVQVTVRAVDAPGKMPR